MLDDATTYLPSYRQAELTQELEDELECIIDRARYYDEHRNCLSVFEKLQVLTKAMIAEQERFY